VCLCILAGKYSVRTIVHTVFCFYLQSVPCSVFLVAEKSTFKKEDAFVVNGISSVHRGRDRGKPAQHGVLPSLAGGELAGRWIFFASWWTVVPPVLIDRTTCPGRSCSACEFLAIPAAAGGILLNVYHSTSSLQPHIADRVNTLQYRDPWLLPGSTSPPNS
jgi:hypothetical protein